LILVDKELIENGAENRSVVIENIMDDEMNENFQTDGLLTSGSKIRSN
jgi:hypothetical protein